MLSESPIFGYKPQIIFTLTDFAPRPHPMGYFRLPAKLRDISRTISRTAWGARIREEDVEDIISTMPEVEPAEGGKYLLKGRR